MIALRRRLRAYRSKKPMPDRSPGKIWIAGHTGLVGEAVYRRVRENAADVITAAHAELDLTRQRDTEEFIRKHRPDSIVIAAARVGGIGANSQCPADFLAENIAIATNIITAAHAAGTGRVIFLGSSCIYPRDAAQPIMPSALLTAPLEPTNEAYASAKIAGVRMCQYYRQQYGDDFIALMPCNLYGCRDRWGDPGAHVIPMLMDRFHRAAQAGAASVTIWGTGSPLREFMHADDLAKAIDLVLRLPKHHLPNEPVNAGTGTEISIRDLAMMIGRVTGYEGDIVFDSSKPDGTPRKIMDSSVLRHAGWSPSIGLEDGLKAAYHDYLTTLHPRNDPCPPNGPNRQTIS